MRDAIAIPIMLPLAMQPLPYDRRCCLFPRDAMRWMVDGRLRWPMMMLRCLAR